MVLFAYKSWSIDIVQNFEKKIKKILEMRQFKNGNWKKKRGCEFQMMIDGLL